MLRPLLVFWIIVYSLRYRTRPWNFFQLNSDFFNGEKKIFSKLELNDCVPRRWRLQQLVDDGRIIPRFPVFMKPEWGQNSHGVSLARDLGELQLLRQKKRDERVTYLLQEAATEKREIEIFYLQSADRPERPALLSVTETMNRSEEQLPVNGINNPHTWYRDRTLELDGEELQRLWAMMTEIGRFRVARVGVRADSLGELLAGRFHVIEVNVFLPMPLVLLDRSRSWTENHRFLRQFMKEAARLAAGGLGLKKRYPIFFHKLVAHYRVKE